MGSTRLSRLQDAPLVLRSRRDVLAPVLMWSASTAIVLAAAGLVLGLRLLTGAALVVLLISSCAAIVVHRRPPATLWIHRPALREQRLSGRIEIDRHDTGWQVEIRCDGQSFHHELPGARRGATTILAVEVPLSAGPGDRVLLVLRGAHGAHARFAMRLTGRR